MRRVSTDLMNNDMQYWMRRTERDMATLENQMARQQKIEKLRDDPLAAARAVRYDSVVGRLERYEKNASYAEEQYKVSEGYARQAVDITQRLREIAVQGANGIYAKEDQKYMAAEVDELIAELVSIGNARGPDGTFLFSGDKSRTEPFRAVMGTAPGAGREAIVGVEYSGAPGGPETEISEDSYMPLTQAGSEVFWAEKSQIVSGRDARDFRAKEDSTIVVDGHRIDIKTGDTVHAVAAKINDSGAAVKASIDPRRFSLSITATLPHEIRMEDMPRGTLSASGGAATAASEGGVLAELGILEPGAGGPPGNWKVGAEVSGGSLFDVAIRLRDSLNKGDVLETGGLALAGLDAGLDNLNRRVAELGSRTERLQTVQARLNKEVPDATRLLATEKDLDITKAITDFRMLEYAHRASLGFAGKLFPQTLLDFLR